jgi:beta-phosphoglucomutase
MTPRIKAVVFDMDGVLIDAREWHYEALNRALGLFGYTISRYDHLVTYDGLPTRQKLEMLSREHSLPRGLHAFVNEMKQVYTTDLIHQRCRPTFAHEYALSRLKADGYRLAVASNSIRATIDLMMEKSALAGYLDFTLSNQDVTKAKPDPEIYAKAVDRLGMNPAQVVVVEDNQNGVRAAQAAGCWVLAVRDPIEVTYDTVREYISQCEGGQR